MAGLLTTLERGDLLCSSTRSTGSRRQLRSTCTRRWRTTSWTLSSTKGPNARSVRLNLPKFTLVGATTRSGMISAPLRSRFGMDCRLDYYSAEHLANIVERSAGLIDIEIDAPGALEIAQRARGTPRIANNLLRWVRDFAQVRADGRINREVADAALAMRDIDSQTDSTKWTSA